MSANRSLMSRESIITRTLSEFPRPSPAHQPYGGLDHREDTDSRSGLRKRAG